MRKPLALALAAACFAAACDKLPTAHREAGIVDPGLALVTPTAGVDHVVITPEPVEGDTMVVGALTAQFTLTATAYDADGDPIPGAEFAWASGNPGVLELSATSGGTVDVTAADNGRRAVLVGSGQKRDTLWIRVRQRPASVALDADSVYLAPGGTTTFTAQVLDSLDQPMASATPTWGSSDAGVASVSGGVVTGVTASPQWVRIRAAYGGVYGYGWVAVRDEPFVGSITVSPAAVDTLLALGRTSAFTAVVRDGDGNVIDTPVTWASSNGAVASIDPNTGVVTAVSRGVADITATASQVTGRSRVRVMQVAGAVTLELDGENDPAVAPGGSVTIDGSATDLDGSPIDPILFSWTSSNTGVATVPATASMDVAVTGVAEGVTTITATNRPATAFEASSQVEVLVIHVPADASSSSDAGGIQLSWTNSSGIETGYRIERSENGGAFTLRATAAMDATGFLDPASGLVSGVQYTYRIKSCNATGCSAASGTTAQTW